ncbi:hypothetical protein L207DRAFT_424909 [Hyaloscypha variabilis F]|uniref:F-box domain-containing protein n=1 Tax=Hyaloscypha variabilis (strain UAMH 11265 / GT02V1 / F) TaxID=1149755 RepID=A0A2J6RUY0_HYAVF|nr:hypothetical protein L207DRAFT_424909 [Hyaloscypha variabilis F]
MDIPVELLTFIASELDSIDLSNFRLVNRACAQASTSLIPRHGISVMNMSRDMKELQYVLQSSGFAKNVRKLRVFHVEWPICSRFDSASARRLYRKAFSAYREIITEQQCRRYSEEIEGLFQILAMLPNLISIHVSDMHDYLWHPKVNRRYHKLQRQAIPKQLNTLRISGGFDPGELYHTAASFSHIQHLNIHDFRTCGNEKLIREFLMRFPNLVTLAVSFQGWSPSINALELLYWPRLEELEVQGIWTSESEFAGILERHSKSLKSFSLHNPALTEGSWQTLLTKMRAISTSAEIRLSGELYGRTSGESLDMGCNHTRSCIEDYLRERESDWPFPGGVRQTSL